MADLEQEVFNLVNGLGALHLKEVCSYLQLEEEGEMISLRRRILRKLSSEGGDDIEDALMFQNLKDFLLALPENRVKEETGEDPPEDEETKRLRKVFLKDFKISGRIGTIGHKDTISYTGLLYQMNSAKERGYAQKEIINAVIRSVVPGLELRSYLEGRPELTYDSLLKTLRSHYQEQDATSLFTTLSTTKQKPKETAQEFAMRLLTLKQKILFVSQEAESAYSPSLVQERFLHTMLIGLKNDNIRTELRPLLKNKATSDDKLLERLTKAMADEAEHLEKFEKAHPVKTASMEVSNVETQKEKKESPIMTELNEVKSQLTHLSSVVLSSFKSPGERRPSNTHKGKSNHFKVRNFAESAEIKSKDSNVRNRCEHCVKENKMACDHCFYCFSSEHFSRGCKKRRQRQTDGKREEDKTEKNEK